MRLKVATVIQIVIVLVLSGCGLPQRLLDDGLPVQLPEIPGIPIDLEGIDGLLGDLGLPDLSSISDLPGVDSLPGLQTKAGQLVFRGPVERGLNIGSRIPGTDIVLVEIGEDSATFMIDELRSERRLGDSLDFDGSWPGLADVSYHTRLRIYRIGSEQVRAAGVHQLEMLNTAPVRDELPGQLKAREPALRFPFTTQASVGKLFGGTTYAYRGENERGAELSGLDSDSYPFRKLGDSIVWEGRVRADIPVTYDLRLLYYGENRAQIGGVVTVYLGN